MRSSAGSGPRPDPHHYSYEIYADPQTANRFDRLRFGGPIGRLLAETQERALLQFAGDVAGRPVVDVGTGTGRAALTLRARGARVTGVDASIAMLAVARDRAAARSVAVNWVLADAHALSFPDRAFDVAVSLRVLMHAPDWRRCLAELCRVADRRVIVDFPALVSAAALQAVARRVGKAFADGVEAYRVFRHGAIARELEARGFEIEDVHRQFVLPIALHKALGSLALTNGIERALAQVGLLRAFGSPVTVVAVRSRPTTRSPRRGPVKKSDGEFGVRR